MTDDTDEPHNHPDPLTHTHDRATSPEAEPHRAVAGADPEPPRNNRPNPVLYSVRYAHTDIPPCPVVFEPVTVRSCERSETASSWIALIAALGFE